MATLYERLGGEQAILLAVAVFYERLAGDPLVNHYFTNIDMDQLAKKQAAFMAMAFDGPVDSDVRGLKEAHAGLGISDVEFDTVMHHLSETLSEIGVDEALQNEVFAILAPTRHDIVEQSNEGEN